MKTRPYNMQSSYGWLLALAGILAASQLQTAVADDTATETSVVTATVQADNGGGASGGTSASASGGGGVIVKDIEPLAEDAPPPRHTRSWLGVGVVEAPEALSSQLNLAPGVGLVVTYVTPESPAAKAGLEENDVLVEFEGQPLVVPAQLRKLVQVRKEGDKVKLGYYRGGKKDAVTITLGKAPPGYGLLENGEALKDDLADLSQQFKVLPMGQAWRDALNAYRDQMGNFKIDQVKIQEEVRRSVEQARRAMEDALRYSTNVASDAASQALKELKRLRVTADTDSSVTVRSSGDRVRSIVKADESGTIVVVSNPKPYLTVHDKEGKLVFDGEIDTPEQRAKVPPEVWQKVEPMLDKLAQNPDHPASGGRVRGAHRPPSLENPGPTPGGQPPTI